MSCKCKNLAKERFAGSELWPQLGNCLEMIMGRHGQRRHSNFDNFVQNFAVNDSFADTVKNVECGCIRTFLFVAENSKVRTEPSFLTKLVYQYGFENNEWNNDHFHRIYQHHMCSIELVHTEISIQSISLIGLIRRISEISKTSKKSESRRCYIHL